MCTFYDYICGNCSRGHTTLANAELKHCKTRIASPNKDCGKLERKKKKVKNDFCKGDK